MTNLISGGISGAISDPLSPEALEHATKYYEFIRHRTDDIEKISVNTGYTKEQVLKVKNYLFIETHILFTGIKQFDPSFEIAETWQRLSDMLEYIQKHDLLLIPHELKEMDFINKGMTQLEAHNKTCLEFDYPRETNRFYADLQHNNNSRLAKKDTSNESVSGGITHNERVDWELYM